jgi:aspartate racemase
MKIIGLVGGISWVSTQDYYKYINQGVNEQMGGIEFARLIIHSMNYGEIKRNNDANDWDANFKLIATAAENMKAGGAEAIVVCANTMHLLAERLEEKLKLPVIHIAVATADEIKKQQLKKVGLLGTKFTMERDFFTNKLKDKGIEAIIPDDADRDFIHWTIFEELGREIINPESKQKYLEIIRKLIDKGAEGIILGCTEIPLLIQQNDVNVPVFDTTRIHSAAAVKFIMGKN